MKSRAEFGGQLMSSQMKVVQRNTFGFKVKKEDKILKEDRRKSSYVEKLEHNVD